MAKKKMSPLEGSPTRVYDRPKGAYVNWLPVYDNREFIVAAGVVADTVFDLSPSADHRARIFQRIGYRVDYPNARYNIRTQVWADGLQLKAIGLTDKFPMLEDIGIWIPQKAKIRVFWQVRNYDTVNLEFNLHLFLEEFKMVDYGTGASAENPAGPVWW